LKSETDMPAASAERIHEANIAVHRFEAAYYELFHPEVYGKQEQKRVKSTLRKVNDLVNDNHRKALDFGAGTGNLTDKLLAMGYTVSAIDISAEMCQILRNKHQTALQAKQLTVINSPIEDVSFTRGEFDLICGYSVLHHLPDYASALHRLSAYLKKGGVMYLDHEASPFYWKDEPSAIANLVKVTYFHSNPLINSLHFQLIGVKIPSLDYTLSDYWHKKEHPIDHNKIEQVFKNEHFQLFKRTDYYLTGTWIFNPLYPIYKRICRPEMSFWITKK
jgi:ubiquinone/menaquinone biosynthesis C-methylase UbiE